MAIVAVGFAVLGVVIVWRSFAAVKPSADPVTAYAFNEGSGTTATDSITGGGSLSLPSSSWTASGKTGSAASFDATSTSFAQRPDAPGLDLTTAGTIEVWYKPASIGTKWHSIVAKGDGVNNDATRNYAMEIDNSGYVVCILGNGTASIAAKSSAALTAGQFYHLACTWNGASLAIFIDGNQSGSVSQSITPAGNASPLYVGQFGGGFDLANGIVDDLRIYSTALSIENIAYDMNTPVGSSNCVANANAPAICFEAEAANLTGAVAGSDASASAGQYLQFANNTPPPPPPPAPTPTPPPPTPSSQLCVTSDGYVNWSDTNTWGGPVPATGSSPTIPAGKKVRLDVDPPALDTLSIPTGTELCVPDRNATIIAKIIKVEGNFTAGTDTQEFTSNLTIRLTGGNSRESIPFPGQAATTIANYTAPDGTKMGGSTGTNVLMAANGGKINIHGKNIGRNWTKLAQTSPKGSNTVTLVDAVQWPVGSRVVVPSSDFDPFHVEEGTITAISADGKTLTLNNITSTLNSGTAANPEGDTTTGNTSFAWPHTVTVTSFQSGTEIRSVEERTEIGLLSHNITITGPDTIASNADLVKPGSTANAFGGQTLILPGGVMRMSNTRVTKMGQYDTAYNADGSVKSQGAILGRYPIHFHIVGDASASEIKNVSIDNSPNRFLTIHATNNLKVSGLVAHDTIGHGVITEDSNERGNIFDDSLVMTIRFQPVTAKRILNSDFFPSEYWFTSVENTFTNLYAAGGQGPGVWWDFTCAGTDNKGVKAVSCGSGGSASKPFGKTENITAHSRKVDPRVDFAPPAAMKPVETFFEYGVTIGDDIQAPGILVGQYVGDYNNRGQMLNFTAWKNDDTGIWMNGPVDTINFRAANNSSSILVENGAVWGGLIAGETNNTRGEGRVIGPSDNVEVGNLWLGFHGSFDVDDTWLANYQMSSASVPARVAFSVGAADSYYGTVRVGNMKFFGNSTACGGVNTPLTFAQDKACLGYRVDGQHDPNYNPNPYSPNGWPWFLDPNVSHWFIDRNGSFLGNGQAAYYYDYDPLLQLKGDTTEQTVYTGVNVPYLGTDGGNTKYGRLSQVLRGGLRFETNEGDRVTDLTSSKYLEAPAAKIIKPGRVNNTPQPYLVQGSGGTKLGLPYKFKTYGNESGYSEARFDVNIGSRNPSDLKVLAGGLELPRSTSCTKNSAGSYDLTFNNPWCYDSTSGQVIIFTYYAKQSGTTRIPLSDAPFRQQTNNYIYQWEIQ